MGVIKCIIRFTNYSTDTCLAIMAIGEWNPMKRMASLRRLLSEVVACVARNPSWLRGDYRHGTRSNLVGPFAEINNSPSGLVESATAGIRQRIVWVKARRVRWPNVCHSHLCWKWVRERRTTHYESWPKSIGQSSFDCVSRSWRRYFRLRLICRRNSINSHLIGFLLKKIKLLEFGGAQRALITLFDYRTNVFRIDSEINFDRCARSIVVCVSSAHECCRQLGSGCARLALYLI